jgi:hypothetical protein
MSRVRIRGEAACSLFSQGQEENRMRGTQSSVLHRNKKKKGESVVIRKKAVLMPRHLGPACALMLRSF